MTQTTNKGVYIDLKTDFGFKHCMGEEASMKSFLNAILSEDYGNINHLEFLPVEQTRVHPELRGVTFDLRCRLDNGDEVIVEMQNYAHPFFKTRANYYLYKLMDKHLKRGISWSEREEDIPRLIGVFILGVPMEGLDKVVTKTAEFDIDKKTEFWDRMRKYYISLPNFQLAVEKRRLTPKDIWFETIKNLGNMEILDPEIYQIADEGLLELIEKAKVSALSEAEYAQYEAELKVLSNRGTVERYNFEQGRKQGLAEGMKQGREKGRKEGMKQGILEIARMMKRNGYPTEEIISMTGLTKDDVENI